jgi:hypothetical protein
MVGAYITEFVLHHAQTVIMTIMVFVLNARVLVTLAHAEHLIVVILVTQVVLDTYMMTNVSLLAQLVIMLKHLPKLVTNVTMNV